MKTEVKWFSAIASLFIFFGVGAIAVMRQFTWSSVICGMVMGLSVANFIEAFRFKKQ